jgi:hypothetical protein
MAAQINEAGLTGVTATDSGVFWNWQTQFVLTRSTLSFDSGATNTVAVIANSNSDDDAVAATGQAPRPWLPAEEVEPQQRRLTSKTATAAHFGGWNDYNYVSLAPAKRWKDVVRGLRLPLMAAKNRLLRHVLRRNH